MDGWIHYNHRTLPRLALLAALLAGGLNGAHAQAVPPTAAPPPPVQPPAQRLQPSQSPKVAPGPLTPSPLPTVSPEAGPAERIDAVAFAPAKAYTAATLRAIVGALVGPAVPAGKIETARRHILDRYRKDGYVYTAVSAQINPTTHVLTFIPIEGHITQIRLAGDKGYFATQVLKFLDHLKREWPLKTTQLERWLLLTSDIPGVSVRSVLSRSAGEPGALILTAKLHRDAVTGLVTADNRAYQYTGPTEGLAVLDFNSFTSLGERTELSIFNTPFTNEQLFGQASTEFFVGPSGLKLKFYGGAGDELPGGPFKLEDYNGFTTIFGAQVSYPWIRQRQQTLDVTANFDALESLITTNINGPDTRASYDSVRVLSAGLDYVWYDDILYNPQEKQNEGSTNRISIQISRGLHALGATSDGAADAPRVDERTDFFRVRFHLSRTQSLFSPWPNATLSLHGAVSGQYSPDILPPAEEYYLGGAHFNRSYYAGEVTGDSAVTGTVELRVDTRLPGWPGLTTNPTAQFYTFFDAGQAWSNEPGTENVTLRSVGLGVRFHPTGTPDYEFDLEGAQRLNLFPNGSGQGFRRYTDRQSTGRFWRGSDRGGQFGVAGMAQSARQYAKRVAASTGVRLVGLARRPRRALLLSTALQATTLMVLALPAAAQPVANAQPQGGNVTAGIATISQNPTTTTINQASQRAAINWSSFNVGSQQTVDFVQPSSTAATLNRVKSPDPSQIAGRIVANGTVVVVNQNGVVFDQGAQVNVGALVVSAAGISTKNFMAGKMAFDRPGNPNASVVNEGNISIKAAGLAALVAPQVANSGVINAKLGHVVLAGARTATLDLYGDGLVSIDVTGQVTKVPVGSGGAGVTALVTNTGTINARGGTVQLTARAVDGLVQNLVTADGSISANSAGARNGTVLISGIGGSVTVLGTVAAAGHAPGTDGGSIAVNATDSVTLAPTAKLDVSGNAGGGVIAVGTTLKRAAGGPSVVPRRTAANVTVQAGATIAANATANGDGGRVTVLSTGTTTMDGAISATGGPQGGNGGFIETSGHVLGMASTARVDAGALAASGTAGSWLLDPVDINITTNPTDGTVSNTSGTLQASSTDTANIFNGDIQTALGSTNVTITTACGGGTCNGPDLGTITGLRADNVEQYEFPHSACRQQHPDQRLDHRNQWRPDVVSRQHNCTRLDNDQRPDQHQHVLRHRRQ